MKTRFNSPQNTFEIKLEKGLYKWKIKKMKIVIVLYLIVEYILEP